MTYAPLFRLRVLPACWRGPIMAFVLVAVAGYAVGLVFVGYNTQMRPEGIVLHYDGNEESMHFGKSPAEMLEIVHNHLLGMGVLFFALACLLNGTDWRGRAKAFWATETLLSLFTTFGGLWLVASGQRWALWIVYPSSILMALGFCLMAGAVMWNCLTPDNSSRRSANQSLLAQRQGAA